MGLHEFVGKILQVCPQSATYVDSRGRNVRVLQAAIESGNREIVETIRRMTAREVFSESHKEMFQSCKNKLMEMGKTCAGLVAAVVFASSFSIPGEKNEKTGNPVYMDRLPFKIFSHTYVIGFSCATTSLVLFLSLVFSPYKEQQFRQAIPTKFFLACLSFAIALLALLVAFTCNIFLQIYGGQRTESDDLIPLILELIAFPALCLIVLYWRGATFWPAFRKIWK